MKKTLGIIVVLLLVSSLLLAACAKPAAPAPTSAPAPAQAPAAPKAITWRSQIHTAVNIPEYMGYERIVKRINAATGGRLVIEPNPGGKIVAATEEANATTKALWT